MKHFGNFYQNQVSKTYNNAVFFAFFDSESSQASLSSKSIKKNISITSEQLEVLSSNFDQAHHI